MKETWRWFGEFDPIALADVAQTGAQGIVSALHAIPYGETWSKDAIQTRHNEIRAAGFTWDVVESLPVHEDIKRGEGDLAPLFANYRQSLANLAAFGVRTVCYNFMPILDWTRTDLASPLPRGGTCLKFDAARMAAFEIHMLKRDAARGDYPPEAVQRADLWFAQSTPHDRATLLYAVMSGLPGAVDRYDISGLNDVLLTYDGVGPNDLRANLARFLHEIIPTATELGIQMCIHPDDPPRPILGLPRVVSTQQDIDWILNVDKGPANGLTLCTGSLGSRHGNDVPAIARAAADRIPFVHLRNVTKDPDGSFSESAHLEGDVNLIAVIDTMLKAAAHRDAPIPFRPDHGHMLLSDQKRSFQPGYSLIGRLRGLSEIRGAIAVLSSDGRHDLLTPGCS